MNWSQLHRYRWLIGIVLIMIVIDGVGWWGYQIVGQLGRCQGALETSEWLRKQPPLCPGHGCPAISILPSPPAGAKLVTIMRLDSNTTSFSLNMSGTILTYQRGSGYRTDFPVSGTLLYVRDRTCVRDSTGKCVVLKHQSHIDPSYEVSWAVNATRVIIKTDTGQGLKFTADIDGLLERDTVEINQSQNSFVLISIYTMPEPQPEGW